MLKIQTLEKRITPIKVTYSFTNEEADRLKDKIDLLKSNNLSDEDYKKLLLEITCNADIEIMEEVNSDDEYQIEKLIYMEKTL